VSVGSTVKTRAMKLLIIDDHPVLRDGLASLLKQAGPDTIIVEAPDAQAGVLMAERLADLDLVILDLSMPGMPGFEALAELGRKRPDLPVIVLSSSEDPKDVRKALASGALGYVPKSASQHVLLAAIKLVLNGDLYVPPLILEPVADAVPQRVSDNGNPGVLTARQIEVLALISEGKPNKTIATELALSEKTVKAHITAIFRALNVVNRTQAAAAARAAGII
jgi:two-component system, NarL family, nitrate/nitrite response regulator NarL